MIFFETRGLPGKELFWSFSMKNIRFPMHFHRAYEFIYVNSGMTEVVIDQKKFILKEKDLAFIFPGQQHEFTGGTEAEMTIFQFAPEMVEPFYSKYKQTVPKDNILQLQGELMMDRLQTQFGQLSFFYAQCNDLILKTKFEIKRTDIQSEVLLRILAMIEQDYSGICTLKTIAKGLQYDYSYLSKLFMQQMHMSFTEYLNQYRVSKACYMLVNTQLSIGEIVQECGYGNLRTFHRNFKDLVKMTPTEYRST